MKKLLVLLALTSGLFAQGSREGDSLALVAIEKVNQNIRWDTTKTFDRWPGVEVTNNRVTALELKRLGYRDVYDSIPPEFGNLTELTTFKINSSGVKYLPVEIVNLTNLHTVIINNDDFFDFIPLELDLLPNLQNLELLANFDLHDSTFAIPTLKKFKLSGKYLKKLPTSIEKLTSLEEAEFSCQSLTELPSGFGNLKQLKKLVINTNSISTIPAEFWLLNNLDTLRFNIFAVDSISPQIKKLTNLQELRLTNGSITGLPNELGELTNLKNLSLSDNKLTSLPQSIGNLSKLEHLAINGNELSTLPDKLLQLKNLKSFNTSTNYLSKSTLSSDMVTFISDFDINWEKKQSVTPEYTNIQKDSIALLAIKNLNPDMTVNWSSRIRMLKWENIGFSNLHMDASGVSFQQNTRVDSVYLNSQKIIKLPPEIGNLTDLKFLMLENNNLISIPESITDLSLQKFATDRNFIFAENLSEPVLDWLNSSHPNWSSGSQKSLEKSDSTALLAIYCTNTLPWDITQSYKTWEGVTYDDILKGVSRLNLNSKELTILPIFLQFMDKLAELNLSDNDLKTVPKALGNLTFLKTLDLSNNQLVLLPKEITTITPRTKLDVSGNNLQEFYLDEEVIIWLDKYDPDWRVTQGQSPIHQSKGIMSSRGFTARFTGSSLLFSLPLPADTKISLYDFNGRQVLSTSIQGSAMNIPPIANGIYLMKIKGVNFTKSMKINIM